MASPSRTPLDRDAWAAAALDALASGGLRAVAVEPLAAALGATKGSFYWHFRNRAALLAAALERWERQHTDAVVARVEQEPTVERRLRYLFSAVVAAAGSDRVELALLGSSDHPVIGPALRRVTERRIAYVAHLFEQLGFPAAEARRRSLIAYTTYLGHAQLAHTVPELLPASKPQRRAHLDEVMAALTQRRPRRGTALAAASRARRQGPPAVRGAREGRGR